jgi:hypothetical protein
MMCDTCTHWAGGTLTRGRCAVGGDETRWDYGCGHWAAEVDNTPVIAIEVKRGSFLELHCGRCRSANLDYTTQLCQGCGARWRRKA